MDELKPPRAAQGTGRVVRPALTGQTGWLRWLPGLQVLRNYQSAWLVHDLMAGLALTAVLLPVGIAYAVASGLPGVCGLYATMARSFLRSSCRCRGVTPSGRWRWPA
jgi:hypothetical protein